MNGASAVEIEPHDGVKDADAIAWRELRTARTPVAGKAVLLYSAGTALLLYSAGTALLYSAGTALSGAHRSR